jgi:GNAT superfamily N-acetyltransferase
VIEDVHDDADRAQVQELLQGLIPGIAHNAVPMSASDFMFAPVIVRAVDDDGRLVGAALSCRAQVAATASALPGRAVPGLGDFGPVMEVHSELDLLAVAPDARGQGVGSALLSAVEARLRERGVRWWFGNVTHGLDIERLRRFYSRHGFGPRSSSGAGSSRPSAACPDVERPCQGDPRFGGVGAEPPRDCWLVTGRLGWGQDAAPGGRSPRTNGLDASWACP